MRRKERQEEAEERAEKQRRRALENAKARGEEGITTEERLQMN